MCLAGFAGEAFAQSPPPSPELPGLIESLERLLDLHKGQFQKTKERLQSSLKMVDDLKDLKEVRLDPLYMKSLLLHSDERFLKYAEKDECKFLSTLETNLLKTAEGNIDNIAINYKNKEGNVESALMIRDNFFEQIYKKRCLNNREFSILFNNDNIKKTVEGIKFSVPKNKNECQSIHKEWLDNGFTPYLCRIQQVFNKPGLKKMADFYRERIPLAQRIYLGHLCDSLSNPDIFCSSYLKDDVWNKILNGEVPDYKMSYRCQDLYNKKEKPSVQEMKNCASKFASDQAFCETHGNSGFPAHFPFQNCQNLSLALNKSKLISDYRDCPGKIDNEALTNIHRIINHFSPRKIAASRDNCDGETHYSFAKLHLDIRHDNGWPLKVCYFDRVNNQESCTPYIPGSRPDEPLSEDKVIAKILYQQKGASPKTTCRIVDSKTYSPHRTEFKFGCFIVYDAEMCTTLSCDRKVIWEEKAQADIKFTGIPVFDYFPTAFMNERYSFTNLLDEVKGTRERNILNLTDLKFFLDKVPGGIAHGIGCAEDLLPEEFTRSSMNQCHPMPFIVDGHAEEGGKNWLVTRLSIEEVHSPRLLPWPHIFNAVSAYQRLHPLNTWTFYGVNK